MEGIGSDFIIVWVGEDVKRIAKSKKRAVSCLARDRILKECTFIDFIF